MLPNQEKAPFLKKDVFTTGDAAKICGVSQQTIIRCFDNEQLKGFRVPGSKFRRIPRQHLIEFMQKFGIDTGSLTKAQIEDVLVIGISKKRLAPIVGEDIKHLNFIYVDNSFEAGCQFSRVSLVLLDKEFDCYQSCVTALRNRNAEGRSLPVIVLSDKPYLLGESDETNIRIPLKKLKKFILEAFPAVES